MSLSKKVIERTFSIGRSREPKSKPVQAAETRLIFELSMRDEKVTKLMTNIIEQMAKNLVEVTLRLYQVESEENVVFTK